MSEEPAPVLRRSLGLADVTLFFIITGSNLQWVAQAAAAGPSSLSVWLIGAAAMFVPLAIVVVYLSSHYPEEGGMYVWSKRAFGPFAGFMTGWTYWTSNLTYFPALLYFAAGNGLFITGGAGALAHAAPYFIIFSLSGLTLATVLNVLGLDIGKWLNNVGAVSRWLVTLLLIAIGAYAWVRFGPATAITLQAARPGLSVKDLIFWSVVAFAWVGPESISFMAGEVKRPRRSIPLGLAFAAPVIALIYLAGTVAVLAAVKPNAVDPTSGVMQTIANVAGKAGWSILTPVAAVLVIVSCLGSCGAWLGATARIPFVAGIDHYLPAAFGKMHPRWGSPVVALVSQSAITAVIIVLGQGGSSVKSAYDILVSSTVAVTMVPFLYMFAAAFKLYVAKPAPDTVRIPGGKRTVFAAATIGFVTTAASLVLALFPAGDEPNKPLAVAKILVLTVLLIGSGVAVFAAGNRHRLAEAEPGIVA
jgi:amino acid transporter